MRFCSECKYSKEHETRDKILLSCTRNKAPTSVKAEEWVKDCTVFRKLNAPCCGYFEERCSE